ncbi:MAG: hypothetical protein LQ343_003759 [Gyalolechia ehrenbergii]|nr:MAG: hypothetical protein LQ343_003759 [Gyalolechia ehrenbergii]
MTPYYKEDKILSFGRKREKITLYHTVLESLEEMKAENQEIMEAVGRFDDFMGALINAFNLARRVDAFDKESVQHFVGGQPHGQLSRDKAKLLRKKRGRLLREGQDIITVLLETFDKLPNDLQELYGETLGFLKGQSILQLSREKSSAGAGRDDNGHYRRDL